MLPVNVVNKIPKILFIRNVFKHNCIEVNEAFEMKIMENSIHSSVNLFELNSDYQKNPKLFEGLDSWPKTTNLRCWYCFNHFTSIPKFIPTVIEPSHSSKYSIGVEGNCCNWACCMSYIRENISDVTKFIEKKNNIYFLYQLWNGVYPKYIPFAPSKYLQKPFGGELTPDEYYQIYQDVEIIAD